MTGTVDAMGVMRPYPPRGEWVQRAACRVVDTDVFYNRCSTAAAYRICAGCPVQVDCLDYALACESLDPYGGHGVWAGLTGQERNRLRKHIPNTQPLTTGVSA